MNVSEKGGCGEGGESIVGDLEGTRVDLLGRHDLLADSTNGADLKGR